MKEYGLFDILGPVMIGPSSSHTAGAVRLGKISAKIASPGFSKIDFLLHGSFSTTFKGHGSDKALVAGILGMNPDNPNIRNAFTLARDKGLEFEFIPTDLGNVHANTVRIVFKYKDKEDYYVEGSSIGGGSIMITNINGVGVELSGNHASIILNYKDRPGIVYEVSKILAKNKINIATMKVSRSDGYASMFCELDLPMSEPVKEELENIEDIDYIKLINPMMR